jgi:hypothetical protein
MNTEYKLHYDAMTDPMCVLRSRLFYRASNPWEGETLEMKIVLIRATGRWWALMGGGAPCPAVFDAEGETTELNDVQRLWKCGRTCSISGQRAGFPPRTTKGRGTLQACEGAGIDGCYAGGGTGGDHGALALGTTWTKGNICNKSSSIFRGVASCLLLYLWPTGPFPK